MLRVRGLVAHFEVHFVPPFGGAVLRGSPAQDILDALAAVRAHMVSADDDLCACGRALSMRT